MSANAKARPKKRRSVDYRAYFGTAKWKRKRAKVIFRDGAQCRACGSRESLEVHHLTYSRFQNELPEDLITLCEKCHKAVHKAKQQAQQTTTTPTQPRRGI